MAMRQTVGSILLVIACGLLLIGHTTAERLRITVDQTGKAFVVEQRQFNLKEGLNEIVWDDVSTQFDLANLQTLLDRYVGRSVTLVRRDNEGKEAERVTGILLSSQGGRVSLLQTDRGELYLNPPGEVILDTREQTLVLKPRLVFQVRARQEGRQTLELSAITRGITWSVQYNLFLNEDGSRARLSSWLSLTNGTNVNWENAYWRVLGEEVRRSENLQPIEERVVVEYRPAGLQQPLTLPTGGSLRLPLSEWPEVTVETRFIFDPIGSGPAAPTPPQRLRRVARIYNDSQHGLGVALPAGKAFLYQSLPAEQLAAPFGAHSISELSLPATRVGDYFELNLGDVPGLEGERKQTAFRQVAERVQEQDIEIILRNMRDEDTSVVVIEHPWGNYEIVQNTHPFSKQRDGSLEFPVDIPAQETVTLSYRLRVRY